MWTKDDSQLTMPTVTTRKQITRKRVQQLSRRRTNNNRKGTVVSVPSYRTKKTKGGFVGSGSYLLRRAFGNCDIVYENTNSIYNDPAIVKYPRMFTNTPVLCGSRVIYFPTDGILTIERRNDGFHRHNYSPLPFLKRRYYLQHLTYAKFDRRSTEAVKVAVGFNKGPLISDDASQEERTDYKTACEDSFKVLKQATNCEVKGIQYGGRAVITEITGNSKKFYQFHGYSHNDVFMSTKLDDLLEKETRVLFTVDTRRSEQRQKSNKKKEEEEIEKMIEKMKKVISVNLSQIGEHTVMSKIKALYSILFLKEYAYQTISSLLILYELHEWVNSNRGVLYASDFEFKNGKLDKETENHIDDIQQACAKKILFHTRNKSTDKNNQEQGQQRNKTTKELERDFGELVKIMKRIHRGDVRRFDVFDEKIKSLEKVIPSFRTRRPAMAVRSVNDAKNKEPVKEPVTEPVTEHFQVHCQYLHSILSMCEVIIKGNEDVGDFCWDEPQELLTNMMKAIKKIDNNGFGDRHNTVEFSYFEDRNDELFDAKQVPNRRTITDYIRQKMALYQKASFYKTAIDIKRKVIDIKSDHVAIDEANSEQKTTIAVLEGKQSVYAEQTKTSTPS